MEGDKRRESEKKRLSLESSIEKLKNGFIFLLRGEGVARFSLAMSMDVNKSTLMERIYC